MHVQVDGFLPALHLGVGVELGGADTAEAREHRLESNLAPRGPEPTRDAHGFIFFEDNKLTRSVENSRCPWGQRHEGQRFSLVPVPDAELPPDDVDLEVRHLVRHGSARTPLPGAPTVGKRCSAVLRGVSHEGRLISGGARNQEPDGDTRRRDSDLDRFGPSDRRNTLRPMSLLYCIGYKMYVDVD